MTRLRLNQEYRNKISNRMRVHLEQEDTQEKEDFFQKREKMKALQNQTWKLAEQIVSRHYTPADIKMAYHLQNKFENVDTIAKDSCFHFGYILIISLIVFPYIIIHSFWVLLVRFYTATNRTP